MNRHEIIDRTAVYYLLSAAGGQRYFSRSIQSPSYTEHLAEITLILEKGHITGALASDELRKHILKHLRVNTFSGGMHAAPRYSV